MEWFSRSCRFLLLALIVTSLCLLIYFCSSTESTITFIQYFREKINQVINVSPNPTDKPVNLRVVNYSTYPILEKVECVPLKTALHHERLCLHDYTTDNVVSSAMRTRGGWEEPIFTTLSKLLAACPNCQFLDIGANIGVYTVTLASMGRTVVAVEPSDMNWLRLTNSIRLNKLENKVTIVTNPVSDVYENVSLWLSSGNPGDTQVASKGNTMSPLSQKGFDQLFRKLPEDVPTIYLDDILPVINFKKAIMKVDIQGYETKAFRKAEKLFQTIEITHVLMEWFGKNSLSLGDVRPLIDFFTNRSYVAHSIDLTVLPSDLEGFRTWPYDIIWVRGRY